MPALRDQGHLTTKLMTALENGHVNQVLMRGPANSFFDVGKQADLVVMKHMHTWHLFAYQHMATEIDAVSFQEEMESILLNSCVDATTCDSPP